MKGLIFGALAGASVILGVAATPSQAQHLSDGTVRLLVPFTAGGSQDRSARLFAQGLSQLWGSDVIVENKTGASGILATQEVASADPDGRTLLLTTLSHAMNSLIYPSVPYDALNDFSFIGQITEQGSLLAAKADGPYKSIDDVMAQLEAGSEPFQFGTPGAGTNGHLSGELLANMSGGEIEPVHFEGGAAVSTAILGGHIPAGFVGIPGAIPHIQAGTLLPLAVTSTERDMSLPDVPTIAESGLEGYSSSTVAGIIGPAGMDPALVAFINDGLRQVAADPTVLEEYAKGGVVPRITSPEEYKAMIEDTITRWEPVIEAAGLKQQ